MALFDKLTKLFTIREKPDNQENSNQNKPKTNHDNVNDLISNANKKNSDKEIKKIAEIIKKWIRN